MSTYQETSLEVLAKHRPFKFVTGETIYLKTNILDCLQTFLEQTTYSDLEEAEALIFQKAAVTGQIGEENWYQVAHHLNNVVHLHCWCIRATGRFTRDLAFILMLLDEAVFSALMVLSNVSVNYRDNKNMCFYEESLLDGLTQPCYGALTIINGKPVCMGHMLVDEGYYYIPIERFIHKHYLL